jgi:DNA-binding NarL/FixJ family response regulator
MTLRVLKRFQLPRSVVPSGLEFGLSPRGRVELLEPAGAFVPYMNLMGESGTTSTPRIFLLVENRLLREALVGILRKQPDLSVVGIDRFTLDAQKQVAELECDILLVHHATATIASPNLIPEALARAPLLKIILFGMGADPESFLQAVRIGVRGYLLDDANAQDILAAVRRVAQGEAVCPSQLSLTLFQFVARAAEEGSLLLSQRVCAKLGLSRRQQQLASFLAKGLTNKEIAASLNLSEFTVKNHVHRMMRQLNVESRYEAVQTIFDNADAARL